MPWREAAIDYDDVARMDFQVDHAIANHSPEESGRRVRDQDLIEVDHVLDEVLGRRRETGVDGLADEGDFDRKPGPDGDRNRESGEGSQLSWGEVHESGPGRHTPVSDHGMNKTRTKDGF